MQHQAAAHVLVQAPWLSQQRRLLALQTACKVVSMARMFSGQAAM
jgi:hypothetical protein